MSSSSSDIQLRVLKLYNNFKKILFTDFPYNLQTWNNLISQKTAHESMMIGHESMAVKKGVLPLAEDDIKCKKHRFGCEGTWQSDWVGANHLGEDLFLYLL